ncbi:glycine betaine ABC transporter substrate-binding protein [Proteinivorax hydrogeniformans]|uniref:Glycine betaine ABC transporter substrate-binding protein n=1 Tax=Proteinivorax hydrogeniformans TaxID=1826727 RepID=A0AAU8HVT3_9FIRM
MKQISKIVILSMVLFLGSACSALFGGGDEIVIGGKNFTEQDIMVYLMEAVIEEHTELSVRTRTFLGGTDVVAQALDRGDLDMYPEYTGTALVNILNMEAMTDPDETYQTVSEIYQDEKNIIWMEPLGFNNTYVLSMRESHAEELGIETVSDLAEFAPDLTLAATHEFLERPDGFEGVQEAYGLEFGDVRGLDPGLTYAAIRDGEGDVNDAFSTDGRILAFDLKPLKDDQNFFPPYYPTPIVRQETLEKHPELEDALNRLGGVLDDTTMAELNGRVDLEGEDARDVARDFLRQQGIIQ